MKTITSMAFILTVGLGILFPMDIFAQKLTEYEMLAPLPGVTQAGSDTKTTAVSYIQGAVKLIISLAAALAVVRIIIGGIQYMSSDAFGQKNEARNTIQNALWGLILAISSFVILNTVNPDLVNLNLKIEGLKGGEPIGTGLGSLPSHEDLQREKGEIGCTNCAGIPYGSVPKNENYPYNGIPFPSKPPPGGCKAAQVCYLYSEFIPELTNVANELKQKNIGWQVTELYPPTTTHESDCHKPNTSKSGQCVDAALTTGNYYQTRNGSCVVPSKLKDFLSAIEKNVGSNFQYEVPSNQSYCRNIYLSSGDLSRYRNKIVEGGTGQHAHINFR